MIKIDNPILDYDRLHSVLANLPTTGSTDLILDLSQVELMTTSAFAYLLAAKRKLMQAGGDLHIQGLHSQPKALCEVLKLCGLSEIKIPQKNPFKKGNIYSAR